MGDKTAIGWTDATWNPVTGCSKVSPGCAHCYAEGVTACYAGGRGWIEEHRPWTPANAEHNVRLRPERLDQPLRWRKPRMVFVNSMSDLFHEQVPDDFIDEVWAVMGACSQHTFQVLTKRPERMQDYLSAFDQDRRWRLALRAAQRFEDGDAMADWFFDQPWPLPNVWLGVSIENRRYVHRADLLRETPAAVRFISAEPLLGPLGPLGLGGTVEWGDGFRDVDYMGPSLDLTGVDWLIVGGESGPKHRPVDRQWVRDLRDACYASQHAYSPLDDALRSGCWTARFFFKQWGGRTQKAGGRELDGRTWDEIPWPRVASC